MTRLSFCTDAIKWAMERPYSFSGFNKTTYMCKSVN